MNTMESSFSQCSAAVSKRGNRLLLTSACVVLAVSISVFTKPLLAAPDVAAVVTSKSSRAHSQKDAGLLAKFRANNWSDYQPRNLPELTAAMKSSAALRDEVVQRFQGATDNVQRSHFVELLRAASIPGFPAQAFAWARDSKDVKTRRSAFTFLATEEQTPEIQALFLHTMMQEQDAQVLGQVVMLGPVRLGVPDPRVVEQVLPRLHELTRHESVEVRAGSLQRLADWDREFRFFPADVMRMLSDPDLDVRLAALGATSMSSYSSEPLKQRLLEILGDPKENLEARSVAALNIERFDFKGDEYVKYKNARAALEKAAAAPVASLK